MRMYFDTIKFVHYFMMILTKFNLHFNMSLSVPRTPLSQPCSYIPPAQHIVRLCRLRAKESVVEGRGGWMHCAPSEVPVNSLQLCSDPPQSVELALVLSRQVKTRGRSEGNELRGRVIIHTPFFLHVADR